MSLRVAFDLDGTVADMHHALAVEAKKLFGRRSSHPAPVTDVAPLPEAVEPAIDHLSLTREQQSRLWNHVKGIEDFWTTLPETEPGIVACISATARARGWEVLFITARPSTAGDTTQRQSQRWLQAHGFELPAVYVVPRSRGRLADVLALDVVVDDRIENCMDVAMDSEARALFVSTRAGTTLPSAARRLGIEKARSISKALTRIGELEDAQQAPGLVGSIRRILKKGTAR